MQNHDIGNNLPFGISPEVNQYINMVANNAAKKALEEYARQNSNREMPTSDKFLSAIQAADFLKIKLNTLYSKVEKGELPSYRSGKRKLLFDKKELEEFVSNKKTKSSNEIEGDALNYINRRK